MIYGDILNTSNLFWYFMPFIVGWIMSEPEESKAEQKARIKKEKQERREARKKEEVTKKILARIEKEYTKIKPCFVISCKACGDNAVVVTFDITGRKITVSTLVNYTLKGNISAQNHAAKVSDMEFTEAFELAKSGEYKKLNYFSHGLTTYKDGFRIYLFEDGLKNFCKDCNAAYCHKHHNTYPVYEDDGWYDYTDWVCPKGHSHMIDD